MTLILALLLQIPWPGPGRAAINTITAKTVVNTARGYHNSASTVSSIAAGAVSHTSGNLVVVGCRNYVLGTTTVTDTAGNTYTALTSYTDGAVDAFQFFYAKNITGNASNVVTCNFSNPSGYVAVVVLQVAGASTTAPFQSELGGAVSSSSTYTSAAFNVTGAHSLVIYGGSVFTLGATWTPGLIGGTTADGMTGSEPFNVGIAAAEWRSITGATSGITAAVSLTSSVRGIMAVAVFQ